MQQDTSKSTFERTERTKLLVARSFDCWKSFHSKNSMLNCTENTQAISIHPLSTPLIHQGGEEAGHTGQVEAFPSSSIQTCPSVDPHLFVQLHTLSTVTVSPFQTLSLYSQLFDYISKFHLKRNKPYVHDTRLTLILKWQTTNESAEAVVVLTE